MTDETIAKLADLVRTGLDNDQADAERHACALDCLGHVSRDWQRVRNERGSASTMDALRSVGLEELGQDWPGKPEGAGHGIHYVTMRGTAMDPARVLGEVASKRALLAEALGWGHDTSRHTAFGEPSRLCGASAGNPCDCGRDDRVRAVLTLLAQPYQTPKEPHP